MAKLDDCLDHNLDADLRADVDEHLRGCEHCLITMNTTKKTIEIFFMTPSSREGFPSPPASPIDR